MLHGEPPHFVEVDETGLAVDAVADDVVELAGEVDLEPVREVAAVVEPHRKNRVARLQAAEVDAHVRLGARVRLHVRVLGAEERLRPVDRELLDLVDDLAATVVAAPGVALGVLVRRDAPDRLEHGRPGEVLRSDQLDRAPLALELAPDQLDEVRIDVRESCSPQFLEGLHGNRHRCHFTGLRWTGKPLRAMVSAWGLWGSLPLRHS